MATSQSARGNLDSYRKIALRSARKILSEQNIISFLAISLKYTGKICKKLTNFSNWNPFQSWPSLAAED